MPESVVALRRFSRTAGAVVVIVGCLVLVGWALRAPVLKSVVPGLATMKANTAIGFVLTGLSLLLLTPEKDVDRASSLRRYLGQTLAAGVAALGALVLGEYLFGWDLRIDQLLFEDPRTSPASHPGRMAPLTALNFVLLGCGLMTLDVESRSGYRPAQFLALLAAVIGLVAAVGNLYSLSTFYRIASYTSMALHTSLAFVLVGSGVLCARGDRGIPALLLAPGPGGAMFRRIVPAIPLTMVALGWLALAGELQGLYSGEIEIGLVVIATIVLFTTIVHATGLAIERAASKHHLAEEAVHRSEARKKAMFEAALDAVISIDDRGRILEFNPAAERLFGYSRSEAEGKEMAELIIPPELRDAHRRGLQRQVSTGESRVIGRRIEMPALRKDGGRFPVELAITRVETEGAPVFTGYLRDLTDRKRGEEELKKSEERFRLLASATSDVVWDWNLVEDTVWWNEGVQTLLGHDRGLALADSLWWSRNVEPEDLPRVLEGIEQAVAGTGSSWRDEYRFRRADGSSATVLDRGFIIRDASGRAVRMIGATVDVTERRELEEQLRQSQKMEAVGQLAGGVAHDFNNLLTAILGYAELLEARVRQQPDLAEEVAEIRKAGERAADLTRQLLAFSRRQVLEPRVLDLNVVVRNLEGMLRRLIGEDVDFVTTLDPSLAPVLADAGRMEQVIVNLVVNSRDAMPRGGQLTIETRNVYLDKTYANQHAAVRPGPYVMLAVADTGVGMDAATQSRIFEPFFTTKSKDKGTGLGLSTVYGIVKQSEGNVWVYSEPGKGTTIKVYLPRIEEAAGSEEPAVPRAPGLRATETILLVEDDPSLRKLTHRILTGLGYTVLEAGRGEDALETVRLYLGPIDLVLTDVVMPGMGGGELVGRLRAIRPEVRVLFMSGYTDDAIVRHNVLQAGTAFLQKPFTPSSLRQKLRAVLSGRE